MLPVVVDSLFIMACNRIYDLYQFITINSFCLSTFAYIYTLSLGYNYIDLDWNNRTVLGIVNLHTCFKSI